MVNKNGFTLIEVIIAIAIMGIIAIGMLSLFSTGFAFIMRAGDKSEAGFNAHSQVEASLNQRNSDLIPSNLKLTFSSDGTFKTAEGNIETLSHTINKSEVIFYFFQPKY